MEHKKNTIYNKKIDLNDKFNYTLNGIEHQISLNSRIIIKNEPLNEKILISNKFLLKYIHDLFKIHNIEYFISYYTLLGYYVFEGINLYHKDLYICIPDHHYNKLIKLKEDIKKDDFIFIEKENYISIKTILFDKITVSLYIFFIKTDDDKNMIHSIHNIESKLNFYDIYPLQEQKYEEFTVSVPNKIDNVLNSYQININHIIFENNNDSKNFEDNHKSKKKELKYNNIEENILNNNINNNYVHYDNNNEHNYPILSKFFSIFKS
jgi:hypothetical protein